LIKYKANIYVHCHKDNCETRIEKGSGKCLDGRWFCNEACFELYLNDNEDLLDIENSQDDIHDKSIRDSSLSEQGDDIYPYIDSEENINNVYDPMEDF